MAFRAIVYCYVRIFCQRVWQIDFLQIIQSTSSLTTSWFVGKSSGELYNQNQFGIWLFCGLDELQTGHIMAIFT